MEYVLEGSGRKPSGKKTIAQLKKECKEKGLVYDNVLKDCREKKKKGKKPKNPEPVATTTPKKKKKKTIAEIKKECK